MVKFKAQLQKFGEMGEKSGWTYILIEQKIAQKILPGKKNSFRVKGNLDDFPISKTAILPFGDGNFVLPVNATIRKGIKKGVGEKVELLLEADGDLQIAADLLSCLEDDPVAKSYFLKLPPSHQRYYSRWIESAKTEGTRTKRIALAISAFSKKMSYNEMMKMNRGK